MQISDWISIIKDVAVPIGLLLLGWIKSSQSQHANETRKTLTEIGNKISNLHTRVAVLEDRGRRPPSYMPVGRTKNDQFNIEDQEP